MRNHYKKISFKTMKYTSNGKTWTVKPGAAHPLNWPVTYYFTEAEMFRKAFAATAEGNLQRMKKPKKNADCLASFWEPSPGRQVMHTIYRDFASYVPTVKQQLVADLGVSARTGQNIVNNLVGEGILIARSYDTDNRTKILIPSIGFVVAYERQMVNSIIHRNLIVDDDGKKLRRSNLIQACYEFDLLRRDFYPAIIYDALNFRLEEKRENLHQLYG